MDVCIHCGVTTAAGVYVKNKTGFHEAHENPLTIFVCSILYALRLTPYTLCGIPSGINDTKRTAHGQFAIGIFQRGSNQLLFKRTHPC